ncbi:MAG: Rpp14/Pop5 family protein [Candidatus Micrarchaeota archaeon]
MKQKKRYLLYAIEGQELDEKTARLLVRRSVYSFLGEHGASEANVKFMEFDATKQMFLLRCALPTLEKTIACLAFVISYNEKPIALRLQKMSGCVKHVWNENKSSR